MFVDGEVPSGTIDGANATFTLTYSPTPAVSLLLVKNGLVQTAAVDFTLSGATITYLPGAIPQVGDSHVAWYRTAATYPPGAPGLLRDDAVSVIANRLGQRTGLAAQIVAEMKLAQMEVEGLEPLPWFLIQSATLVTSAGVPTVTVPEDFIREFEDASQRGALCVPDGEGGWVVLRKVELDEILASDPESGRPTHYTLVGSSLYLFPTPDTIYSLLLRYYASDTVLDDNIKNGWLTYAPDVLVARAGTQVARFLRDQGAVMLFQGDYELAVRRMMQRSVSREMASTDLRFGEL